MKSPYNDISCKKTGHVKITNQCSFHMYWKNMYKNKYIHIIYIYTIMHKDVYLHTPMTWTFQFHRSHTRFASPALWRLQSWSTPVWTRYKVGPYHYKAHVAIHWWPSCLWEFCHVFVICMFVWWLEVVIVFLDGVITPHYPSYMAKYRGYNPIDAW